MALRIRYQYAAGASLGYSIERLADGLFFDFDAGAFKANPAKEVTSLTAEPGRYPGRYCATLTSTPIDQFQDGQYAIGIHDMTASKSLVGLLDATMFNGDDSPQPPSASGADPWSKTLPGTYGPGTAGYLVGNRLDVPISSRSTYAGGPVASVLAPVTVGTNADKTGYALAQAFPANFASLAITAGGAVTAGTVSDKAGYSLAPTGLDSIMVETGVNARQALSPILASAAGMLSGAGTGAITIRGGNVSTTRITATTDSAGNRTSVILTLPT